MKYTTLPQQQPKYSAVKHENFRDLVDYGANTYGEKPVFIVKHRTNKTDFAYENISYKDFSIRVRELGAGMLARGWQEMRIAIFSANRYEWMLTYLTTLSGVGISVPLDKALPYDEFESSVIRSESDILVYGQAQAEFIEKLKSCGRSPVKYYVCMDDIDGEITINGLREEGRQALLTGGRSLDEIEINPFEMAILLFTSGTTSMAKAVMLSEDNILSDVYMMRLVEDIRTSDTNMAFLPYHHTFGCTGQLLMQSAGVTTSFCDGLKYLQKNIIEYKVSVFMAVPVLVESMYKRIMIAVKKQGKENTIKAAMKLSNVLLKIGIDVRRKFFKQILDQLGGELRLIINGASAADPDVLECWNSIGIETLNGYGLTETSPCLASESHYYRRKGSIGLSMPGIELAIDNPNEDGIGELIGRGPNVMLGYYENQAETDEIIVDGWIHTGDLAKVDKDGYIYICGRKKNVIVLRNGKNVYPEEIEAIITENLSYATENIIVGLPRHEGDKNDLVLTAKIVYDPELASEAFGTGDAEEIDRHIRADIEKLNEQLPAYKQIIRVFTTDQPMIKTTTGKVKRFEEIKTMK